MTQPDPVPSVVIFVSDVPAVSRFYREIAAMALVHQDADHAILEIPGFQLVVHALRGEPQPPRDARGQVQRREDSYLKVCLPVRSLVEARAKAAELGGILDSPEHEWVARGFRACDGHDVEGNVVQLREHAP